METVRGDIFGLVDLDALVARANALKPLPETTVRLAQLIGSGKASVQEIANVVAFDPAMTLRLLKVANSAFSGGGAIINARDAVTRLGTGQVLAMALASAISRFMQKEVPYYDLAECQLWRHSVAAALAAEAIYGRCREPVPPESFAAALLHDIGKLVVAQFLNPELQRYIDNARLSGKLGVREAESQVLQVTHGEIGGIIAQHWNLPERIVKGIIYHDNPEAGDEMVCWVVCFANHAAKLVESRFGGPAFDESFPANVLEELGLAPEAMAEILDDCIYRFAELRHRYHCN
jgi:HD-like signal output (HDOD) protein